MIDAALLRVKFDAGLPFDRYLETAKDHERPGWVQVHERVGLTPEQRALVASFTRRVNVIAISGTWCGDCVHQAPMLARIAEANPSVIALRFVDRDEHADLAERVRICGGKRVPTVLFLNEDFEFLSLYGDKSLARLRALAAKSLGAACAVPGAPLAGAEAAATMQDWVNEFERAHLIARLSPRLRERHGD